uniref:Uncharacterized protein n=1 Tax=Anguilla anguilla TaxID=7936 RepID=A0A0E9XZC1_ANGAN
MCYLNKLTRQPLHRHTDQNVLYLQKTKLLISRQGSIVNQRFEKPLF